MDSPQPYSGLVVPWTLKGLRPCPQTASKGDSGGVHQASRAAWVQKPSPRDITDQRLSVSYVRGLSWDVKGFLAIGQLSVHTVIPFPQPVPSFTFIA